MDRHVDPLSHQPDVMPTCLWSYSSMLRP